MIDARKQDKWRDLLKAETERAFGRALTVVIRVDTTGCAVLVMDGRGDVCVMSRHADPLVAARGAYQALHSMPSYQADVPAPELCK